MGTFVHSAKGDVKNKQENQKTWVKVWLEKKKYV